MSPALRLNLFQAASQFLIRQDQLRGRKDGDRFQLLNLIKIKRIFVSITYYVQVLY